MKLLWMGSTSTSFVGTEISTSTFEMTYSSLNYLHLARIKVVCNKNTNVQLLFNNYQVSRILAICVNLRKSGRNHFIPRTREPVVLFVVLTNAENVTKTNNRGGGGK